MEESLVIIQEVRRGYELMLKLQSHINRGSPPQSCLDKDICRVLCQEALQSCNAALHQLKESSSSSLPLPPPPPPSAGAGPSLPHISSPPPEPTIAGDRGIKRVGESERKFTISPFDGGHQWRKYGEKAIAGSKFTRSYYRCGYKEDQNCQAKMRVQQWNDQSPPMYLVTYEKEHICSTPQHLVTYEKEHICSTPLQPHICSTPLQPQNEPFPKRSHSEVSDSKQEQKFSKINITAQAAYDAGESSSDDLQRCDSDHTSLNQEGHCSPYSWTSSENWGGGGGENDFSLVDVFASPPLLLGECFRYGDVL